MVKAVFALFEIAVAELVAYHVGWADNPTRVIVQQCSGGEYVGHYHSDPRCGECSALGHCGWTKGFTFYAFDSHESGTTRYYVSHAGRPMRTNIGRCPHGESQSNYQDPRCAQCSPAGHCGWTYDFSFWAYESQKNNTQPIYTASARGPQRSMIDSCPSGTHSSGMCDTPCDCSAAGHCGWGNPEVFYAYKDKNEGWEYNAQLQQEPDEFGESRLSEEPTEGSHDEFGDSDVSEEPDSEDEFGGSELSEEPLEDSDVDEVSEEPTEDLASDKESDKLEEAGSDQELPEVSAVPLEVAKELDVQHDSTDRKSVV